MSLSGLAWLENLCKFKFFKSSDLRKTSLNRKHSSIHKPKPSEPRNSKTLLKQDSTLSRKSDLPDHNLDSQTPIKKCVEEPQVTEKDFRIMQVLRAGKNWRIYMVRKDDDDKNVYAMKLIGKKKMAKNSYADQVAMEKEILENAKFPFIPTLEWYFENDKKIFFVMEFVEGGGSLKCILKQLSRFSEEITRFYSAEILLTLEYLHTELNVAYNAVKLRNFLIDPQGHIKLLDYSQAKKTTTHDKSPKENAYSGSPKQEREASPEEMNDFWGFGCLIYELLTGRKPFSEGGEDVDEEDVSPVSHLSWPTPVSKNAKDLITRLLTPIVEERLGYHGIDEIKKHAFFSQLNWEKMLNKSVYPPLDPAQYNQEDNFDAEECDDDDMHVPNLKYLNPSSLGKIVEGSLLNSEEGFDAVSFDRTTNLSSALGLH